MCRRTSRTRLAVYLILLMAVALFMSGCKDSSEQSPGQNDNDANNTGPGGQDATNVSDGQMVPVVIELPKPMFVGTPQNISVPNLEKPLGKARPPFLAPAGVENVALGKMVTSSDPQPTVGKLDFVTDADKEATDGSYVELGPFVQHVTIDLGGEYEIYAVVFWHYHKQARVYSDVIVQVAGDPDFVTGVKTLFNNDIDNSAGLGIGQDMHYVETAEGKLVYSAEGVRGRYVRLYSGGSSADDFNHYIEVEVYGKPAK
jgi:hypothetical protein